jgi:hypothetical protein
MSRPIWAAFRRLSMKKCPPSKIRIDMEWLV